MSQQTLQPGDELQGFTVRSTEKLPEIDGQAIVMDHAASGAKLLYLKNDDENKSFSIGFKTPPADDTGVFHILEHSVLCGSEKFPVKEPFVNLLRTSMQTFLNAITFPDKTMYPVASTNEQDLINLMDVYLDAVLHPVLHTDRHIFEQEGWHYELERNEAGETKLVYNGVVFNEMKGALSDPESVLYHAVNRALFPGTCYAYESGGRPRAIPQLTYESYCDTHARHYRLDNAYLVLYGDLDIDRILGFLDENYLREQGTGFCSSDVSEHEQGTGTCSGDASEDALAAGLPNPIGEIVAVRSFDNVVEMQTSAENAMVGLGYVVGSAHDFERVLAVDIVLDALMGGNESPLKRAILDAQLGGDCTAYLLDSQAAPVALFLLKNAKPGVASQFQELIEAEVRKLVEGGIPRDVLEASLAQMAFSLRERDRGMADGVVLAIGALGGWIYADEDATLHLHYEQPLERMRDGLGGRYFEDLLGSLVLDSPHAARVDLQPVERFDESEEAVELAAYLDTLDSAALDAIDADVAALRQRQESPDTPEALATLPQLHVSDIGPAKPEPELQLRDDAPLRCLYHDLPTHRIAYLCLYFNLAHLNWEDIPYVSVLAQLLGNLDTATCTAAELDVKARQHLGRMNFATTSQIDHEDSHTVRLYFTLAASALSEELESLADIPREVWETTCFDDAARIRDILVQRRIVLEESFINEGHIRAMGRAGSYLFESGVIADAISGVGFYYFLKDLLEHFDERFDELRERLKSLQSRIFTASNCTASFTGSPDDYDAFWSHAGTLGLEDVELEHNLAIPAPTIKREAFSTPNDVCFVAKAMDFESGGFNGTWQLLSRIMGFDYLWSEVRVKGGAYGCGFRSMPSGHAHFYSYRDPQLDATLSRFGAAGKWLAEFNPSPDEMEGYIVSAVASHDAPQKPRLIARRQDDAYFMRRPEGWRDYLRQTLLDATPDGLRSLAPVLDKMAESDAVCVFGSAEIVAAASESLNQVELLG